MKCKKCNAPVGFSRLSCFGLPPTFRNSELVTAWEEYKQFMMENTPLMMERHGILNVNILRT